MLRQDAIKSITAFLESGKLQLSKDTAVDCCSLLVVVGEHTRAFKETNVNIMKAIIQLFLAISECHETIERTITPWEMKSGVGVAVSKIADKKLSTMCKSLLTEMCVVYHPHEVLLEGFRYLKGVKSPIAHEEYLGWIQIFCRDFGASSIGSGLTDLIPLLLEVRNGIFLNKYSQCCVSLVLLFVFPPTGSCCFKYESETSSHCVNWFSARTNRATVQSPSTFAGKIESEERVRRLFPRTSVRCNSAE